MEKHIQTISNVFKETSLSKFWL